jgi:hypothetical protein
VEAGALAREYQNALECHRDALAAKSLAESRFIRAERRLAGARKALVRAGIDVESLEKTEEK